MADVSSHLISPVQIGDIVDKYRVESVVGVGAMGLVVCARHTTLDQRVAMKFLVAHHFGSRDESIARFVDEARAAARIASDHVCRVSDVGMLPSGVPYMIMEHLEGNDLEEEIVLRGQLDLVESVDYVLQALDAITAAHQLGVIHRDLKPANIFVTRRPDGSRRVKVLDFGISKAKATTSGRSPRETTSLGTPAYMAPEQIKDPSTVDHRIDIWALGAILYELITGQMAFLGEDVNEVLDRVVREDPCPIPALRRDVPPDLIAVIHRALARNREARWPTAALFARSLAQFGSVGIVSGLASIQREVGSLSSVDSYRTASTSMGPPTPYAQFPPISDLPGAGNQAAHSQLQVPSPSVEAVVAPVRAELQTQPEPSEESRPHGVASDTAALRTRLRTARSAVLAMVSMLLLAGAAAMVFTYRGGLSGHAPAGDSVVAIGFEPRVRAGHPPPTTPIPHFVPTALSAKTTPRHVHSGAALPPAPSASLSRLPQVPPTKAPSSSAR